MKLAKILTLICQRAQTVHSLDLSYIKIYYIIYYAHNTKLPIIHKNRKCSSSGQKKCTLVSGNAGDEKNLHPGGRRLFFKSI